MLASLNQGTQSLGSMFRVQENDMRKSGVKCQGEIDLMGHCDKQCNETCRTMAGSGYIVRIKNHTNVNARSMGLCYFYQTTPYCVCINNGEKNYKLYSTSLFLRCSLIGFH